MGGVGCFGDVFVAFRGVERAYGGGQRWWKKWRGRRGLEYVSVGGGVKVISFTTGCGKSKFRRDRCGRREAGRWVMLIVVKKIADVKIGIIRVVDIRVDEEESRSVIQDVDTCESWEVGA